MDYEQEPSDLQSLEEMQVSSFEDLVFLRSLAEILCSTSRVEQRGSMQRRRFDGDIAYTDDALLPSGQISGELIVDPAQYGTFELRFSYSEQLGQYLPDYTKELDVEITIINGTTVATAITQRIMGAGYGENGAVETTPITDYDLDMLAILLDGFAADQE